MKKNKLKKKKRPTLAQAASAFIKARKEVEKANERLKAKKEVLAKAEEKAIRLFERQGVQSVALRSGQHVFLQRDVLPYIKAENRERVYAILKELGFDYIVKEDVPWQTLRAWVKELDTDPLGMPKLPERLAALIDLHERFSIRARKR